MTFEPTRLQILEHYESNICKLYEIKNNLDKQHKQIIENAILSVSDQIFSLISSKTNIDKAINDLLDHETIYRQETCGHLDYNDNEGTHMCLWCGKDLD